MKDTINKSGNEILRQKAEELWEHKFNDRNPHLAEYEALKLIHELQVHQIELELQNEELIIAKRDAVVATEKYTDLFDFAPSGYFGLSPEYEIIDLNFKGAEMLGNERGYLKNQSFYRFVSGDSKPAFTAFIEKVFKTNTTQTIEIKLINGHQSPLYVFITGIAKENEKQCLVNVVDINQRKQMEFDLIRAKEKAEESERLKTAFLQNMSHEIRTPLNAIMGFSELLTENFDNKTNLESYAAIINQRSSDLLEIINDILDISRIESGQLTVPIEECNLSSLFEELLAFFTEYQKRIDKPHVKLILKSFTQGENVILTDSVKLKQIFINLIGNAFKFTNEGKIEVGYRFDNNDKLLFYVSDTGVGIPIDKQALVFDRFTQLQQGKSNIIGGTGLGLSIVKGLVGLLGGEIFLESEPSKGSTFSFTLPYKLSSLRHQSLETENYNTKNARYNNSNCGR